MNKKELIVKDIGGEDILFQICDKDNLVEVIHNGKILNVYTREFFKVKSKRCLKVSNGCKVSIEELRKVENFIIEQN